MSYLPVTYDMIKESITAAGCKWEIDSRKSLLLVSDEYDQSIAVIDMYVPGEFTFGGGIYKRQYTELAQELFEFAMTSLNHRVDDYSSHWALKDSEGNPTDIYLAVNSSGTVFVAERVEDGEEDDYGYSTAMDDDRAADACFDLGIAFDAFQPESVYRETSRRYADDES